MTTVKELKAQAKERGIRGYYRMRKAALVEALEKVKEPAAEDVMVEPVPEIKVPIREPTPYVKPKYNPGPLKKLADGS